jgi:hypothetical protein
LTRPGAGRITDPVADPVSPSAEKASRSPVLFLTNDSSLAAARTSRHLALALNRLGYRTFVRDTRLIRWGALAARNEDPTRREAFEAAAVAKWAKLVEDCGIGLVASLDLHWLVSKHLFVNDDNVAAVHSFWVSDVAETLSAAPTFALEARELIAASKVTHHVANDVQAEALRKLGVKNLRRYPSALPAGLPGPEAERAVGDRFWENLLEDALR